MASISIESKSQSQVEEEFARSCPGHCDGFPFKTAVKSGHGFTDYSKTNYNRFNNSIDFSIILEINRFFDAIFNELIIFNLFCFVF